MAKLSTNQRNKLTDSDFGIPEERMYPLHDKAHVESAVKLFGHAKAKYKKSLARRILSRAKEYGLDTSGWKQVLAFAQEQVPPMSDGTSIGNSPPRLMAPYYDEQDELLERVNDLDGVVDPFVFAKNIVTTIRKRVDADSKPPTGNQNCQLCTWCAEANFRGRKVLPRPIYSPRDPALDVIGETIVMNPVRESFSSQRDVIERVRGNVDSRWYVHVNWKDSTGGHEFLVVNIKDYAYIMDAQAGILKEIDETDSTDSYFRDINFDNSYMVRLDNKPFNDKLFNEMNDISKLVPWDESLDIPYMREHGMLGDEDEKYARDRSMVTEEDEPVQEAACVASLLNVKNQLTKILSPADFEFIGGSMIPKFTIKSKEKPDVSFEVNVNGQNIEVTPAYKGIPDILHKRRGIAIMRAANIIADFVQDIVNRYKPVQQESFIDEYATKRDDYDVLEVPSDEATEYLKKDPECKQYWQRLNKETHGEVLVDTKTKDQIGHAFVYHTKKDKGFIFNINVDPKYRGKGYGKILLDDCVKKYGGYDLTVDCDNKIAVNMYLKYGFKVIKTFKNGNKEQYWMKLEKSKITQEGAGIIGKARDMTLVPVKDFKYNKVYYGDPTDSGSVRKLDSKPLFVTPYPGLASIFLGRRQIFRQLSQMGYHEVNLGYDEWGELGRCDQPLTDVHVYVKNQPDLKPFTAEYDGYLHTIDCSQLKENIFRYPWMSDPDHEVLIAKVPEVKIENVQRLHIRYHVRGIPGKVPETPYQEGATQDIKNGVNPYSDKLVFHVSPDKHLDGQVWQPRVPEYLDPYNPDDTGFEDNTSPRICFSTSIEGALNGITVNIQRQSPDTFDKMYVYIPEKPWKEYKHKTNKELVKEKLVYDANVTREVWITEPVRMKLYGVIRVDQVSKMKRKSVVPTASGVKDKRNYYTYKWHWVVKPKVLDKATRFDYSVERVLGDLCIDIKKFRYGLIKDGRLMTGNVSDKDYDKYWVFHSGQEVDEAGGGNCYDMVEYEAGYLDAFGIPYKKYFMNFTKTDGETTVNTHTICVVPKNGKFIYLEQAFKRVVDEWGYERQKTFDSLKDIFQYVADVVAEYENQDVNYGVWDYTDAKIDYGTPIKDFMDYIMKHCKMIHDGEAKMNGVTEEMDMFITIGDSMFYVSEYHNALFDDPDAHDEVINKYGILLDSYDDIVQEIASYGPYDEYLKKHKYDPSTNTIEDPKRPDKRVSAGKIGSEKERRRMNRFLRENDYDPKTDTIQTDINDDKNPGVKRRIKFNISPHVNPAYVPVGDDNEYLPMDDRYIQMSPKDIMRKPSQSEGVLKHEEGHRAYDLGVGNKRHLSDAEKFVASFSSDEIDDINLSDPVGYHKDMGGKKHDLTPEEYAVDLYSTLHSKHSGGGNSQYLKSRAAERVSNDASLKNAKKTVKQYSANLSNDKKICDQASQFVKRNMSNNPGLDASDADWEQFIREKDPILYNLIISSNRKSAIGFIKLALSSGLTDAERHDIIDMISSGSVRKLNDLRNAIQTRTKAISNSTGIRKRQEFVDSQLRHQETKQRQLAKEQLKQQIASGLLSGDQAAKAERKIQRIEAFEKRQAENANALGTPVKKKPVSKQDKLTVADQKVEAKPTIKKEGYYMMDRFGNRLFTEAKDEEMLSDDMEDITIGDLNLEDDEGEEQETETEDTKSKKKDDEEPEEDDSSEPKDDGPMDEVPSYLKDRMSEEDWEDFEQPDENISARDVDLGQFGKDQSDVQNDFDPKEVTILMKLMASEADAMNEYMDGAKETNVDVLRRLYADIANEERFHMEQLLFAKCELTGEQYQPKDPEVKSEYEELLKMGMDEETAMQTAVDKCHIRGSISEDDDEERVELQADVETMEMQINMFNALYDQVITEMESGSAKDVNHAYDVFIEATYDATAASSETSALSETQRFGPLKLIRDGLRFLVKTLMMLIRKFSSFCKKLHNRSREIKRFIKNYGWEGLFDNKYRMYFVDFKDPRMINDSVKFLLSLACDTMNAALKTAGINDQVPNNLPRNPRMDIHGNVKRGIELLNGVQLIKSPMVLSKDEAERNRIAEAFFGYNEIKGTDAKSINVANSLQVIADDWIRFLEMVDERSAKLSALVNHQTSIYYTNKKQYDLAVRGLEAVTKTCKAMVAALQNDINVVMKLNNEAAAVNMKDTNERDKQDMAGHGYYTTLSQNYEKNYRRVPDRFKEENK